MADTLTPEKWGRKESADWWSAGQARAAANLWSCDGDDARLGRRPSGQPSS